MEWAHTFYGNKYGITLNVWCDYKQAVGCSRQANIIRKKATQWGVLNNPVQDMVNGDDLLQLFPDRKPGVWVKNMLGEARRVQYSLKKTFKGSGPFVG